MRPNADPAAAIIAMTEAKTLVMVRRTVASHLWV